MSGKVKSVMTKMAKHRWSRYAGPALATALLLGLSGDGIGAGSVTGIDPLDVLDLQVKPNVIIVLDSSGSMQEGLYRNSGGGAVGFTGDWRESKMGLAKTVLSQVISDNASKATYLFGQYTQQNSLMENTGLGHRSDGTGDRFRYYADVDWNDADNDNNFDVGDTTISGATTMRAAQCAAPWTTPCELAITREPGIGALGITITAANNRFEWRERITTASPFTYAQCGITLTNGTYTEPFTALLADFNAKAAVANLPTACTKFGQPSISATNPGTSLSLGWDAANSRFQLGRGGSGRRVQLLFANTASVGPTLGFGSVNQPATLAGPGPGSTNCNATTFADANWFNAFGLNASGAANSRGFQAWQWITPSWNQLYFTEGATACAVTITPKFYAVGQQLANEIAAQMNACARPAPANVYRVSYNTVNGRFTWTTATAVNGFTLRWTLGPNNIGGALAAYTSTAFPGGTLDRGEIETPVYTDATVAAGGNWPTPRDSIRLLRRAFNEENEAVNFDPDGPGPLAARDRTTYRITAGAFFNGELFYVHGDGSLCGVDFSTPAKTDPPSVRLQQVSSCANPASATVGSPVVFEFGGGVYGGNSVSCNGFQANVKLTACDAASNVSLILPNLEREFPVEHDTVVPAFGLLNAYQERQDGTRGMSVVPAVGGVKADGSTPIANSLISIRTIFGTSTTTGLWGAGQADDPATPTVNESRGPIRRQASPREPTFILFVTDGDDTCGNGGSGNDDNALRAAAKAEDLYRLIEADKPESSVTTYVIGFGTGASTNRLNWIAWGGSGLGQGLVGQPQVATTGTGAALRWDGSVEDPNALDAKRSQCTTCVDAFIAPDAATLAAQIQSILNQGAGFGEFTAQQSVFTSIPELVKELDTAAAPRDPESPNTRYLGLVPNLFQATFEMPGFKGQLKAFQNSNGEVSLKWNAGRKLYDRVANAMAACNDGGTPGNCTFASLLTRVNRRIYTSSRNGVFPTTVGNLTSDAWLSNDGNRTVLWPASTLVAPSSDTLPGILDAALGLPLSDTDPNVFTALQNEFKACQGAGLPAACTGSTAAKNQRARREARETILAFMAGARMILDANLEPLRSGGAVLYAVRDWMLADSTLAAPAVVGPPIEPGPEGSGFEREYELFRDGFRDADNLASFDDTRIGFGLRNPDRDKAHADSNPATSPSIMLALKPAMSVAYVGANDMLHAFRAGPSCNAPGTYVAPPPPPAVPPIPFTGFPYTSCAEQGGEELWGFVPHDQLGKLRERLQAQTRASHTYMIATGLRFADVFVPNPGTASDPNGGTVTIRSESLAGVWRRLLVFGRGIGGKYLTALDVTTPGHYKTTSANSVPPVVLWNRGNVDTQDGTTTGPDNHNAADRTDYARMGETWSVPTIAFVDRAANTTSRKATGVDFVVYVGSGYGDTSGCPGTPCEGQTFFTLDALTGDIVAAADIPQSGGTPNGGYANSLVANAVAYNERDFTAFVEKKSPHPAAGKVSRVYIGDLHGRVWKFNSSDPDTPLLLTDLGIEQPIAAAVTLLGLGSVDGNDTTLVPHVYVNSGYDRRQDPAASGVPFVLVGVRDDTAGAPTPSDACQGDPVTAPCLFKTELTQDYSGLTGYFRGTNQPASILVNTNSGQGILGRVFFAGTRFNSAGSKFAPTPCTGVACNPVVPCRSSFDSILYALGARSGDAAFDLNEDGDDSFVILDNSKIAGIGIIGAPDPTGGGDAETKLFIDEGLDAGTPPSAENLPEGGDAPGQAGTGGVTTLSTRPSSTVCQ